MDSKTICVELVRDKNNKCTILCYNFNLFNGSSSQIWYQRKILSKFLLDGEYKPTISFFSLYIDNEYVWERAFRNELSMLIYEKSGLKAKITPILEEPKEYYYPYTIELHDKLQRDRECIRKAFIDKVYDAEYEQEYPDGNVITVFAHLDDRYKFLDGKTRLSIFVHCDDGRESYYYDGDVNEPFNENLLSKC